MNRLRLIRDVLNFGGFVLAGGFLLLPPANNAGSRGVALRLSVMLFRYFLFWTLVALAIGVWWPTLLVGTTNGLQTALQVLPATVVAILVLTLGSLFVVAQTATTTWGTRAPLMLGVDDEVARLIGRPLLLAAASLFLSGQVPEAGAPPAWVTAAVAALILATARLVVSVAALSAVLIQRYTLPRAFPQHVVADLERELDALQLGYVVSRAAMLGEMARMSLRRGDSTALSHTLEATRQYHLEVATATKEDPSLRDFTTDEGALREGWLAEDLTVALVRVGEEALATGAPGADTTEVAVTLGTVGSNFLRNDDEAGARRAMNGLVELGTTTHQVQPGIFNFYSEPAFQLAYVEAVAEDCAQPAAAAHALAGWALCTAYAAYHYEQPHPLFEPSIQTLGHSPPWADAAALARSDEWCRSWANKLYLGPEPVLGVLEAGEEAHG